MEITDVIEVLRQSGIQPTPQRIAVAQAIFEHGGHLTAEEILDAVGQTHRTVSRATIYNTLHILTRSGLLRERVLRPGVVVYDACMEEHHHLVDEETGEIHDIPPHAIKVSGLESLSGFEITEVSVILRGRKKAADTKPRA